MLYVGEIIMRWGIFWCRLQFDIAQPDNIIKAAMLLHNFIIDEREKKGFHKEEVAYFNNFSLQDLDSHQKESDKVPSAVATNNNEPNPGGRPLMSAMALQQSGECLCDSIMHTLFAHNLGCPMTNGMMFNEEGQLYFTQTS